MRKIRYVLFIRSLLVAGYWLLRFGLGDTGHDEGYREVVVERRV